MVVPNAAAPEFRPISREAATAVVRDRFGIPAPFVLSVGDLQPRKNHIGLIKAFARMVKTYPQLRHRLVLAGKPIGAESSANKLFWSELDVVIHETALGLLGERATVDSEWLDGFEFSLAGPIYAGTNEVQRNVVAERVLGLPRA